jgi:hypothetical protein
VCVYVCIYVCGYVDGGCVLVGDGKLSSNF